MSGIAGIYHVDGRPVDSSLLHRMIDCVPHRGTDGVHVYTKGSVGLAHRQLCSTEESLREVQPASNSARSCWITFDGRIDNREELIGRLHAELDSTDVDLMLRSYERWGMGCLAYLLGDFAFALWDSSRQLLFCGRDHYGIRPFYFHHSGSNFFFGSEVRQILQNPDLPMEINEEAVAEWLTAAGLHGLHYRDSQQSFFRGIWELPAAHYLTFDQHGLQVKRFWDLDPKKEIRHRNRKDYFVEFSEIFRRAVGCRLRSHGPVGAELSGGFDSSSIVCVAQEIRADRSSIPPLIAFSMVFDELSCDERPIIRSVVETCGVEVHSIVADNLCGLLNLPSDENNLRSIDRPDQFALEKAGEILYRSAHDRGIRVMLSGEGAESHVMGSQFVFDSLIQKLEWVQLIKRLAIIRNTSSWKGTAGKLIRYGLIPLLPRTLALPFYLKQFHADLKQDQFPAFYTPRLRSLIQKAHVRQKERLTHFPSFRTWGRQLEYENLNPGVSLLRSFCQPVERRFPYHDRRLVEYCLALPPEVKYEHRLDSARGYVRGRVLQKEAFKGVLPETIRELRSKVNFNDLYRRRFVEAKETLQSLFQPPAAPLISEMGLLDRDSFWECLSTTLRRFEHQQVIDPRTSLWVNRFVQLELWLRQVLVLRGPKMISANKLTFKEEVLAF